MKQIILTGLAAAIAVTASGEFASSEANQEQPNASGEAAQPLNPAELAKMAAEQAQEVQAQLTAAQVENQVTESKVSSKVAQTQGTQAQETQTQLTNVTKVGESQAAVTPSVPDPVLATLKAHQQAGRQATTVYVRNIPIVTFLGNSLESASSSAGVKVASLNPAVGQIATGSASDVTDPVWRASTIAAKINQLSQEGLDAKTIKVVWSEKRQSYLIQAGDKHLIEVIEKNTVLPKTTNDTAQDALQITNRLRYYLGKVGPLKEIEGMAKPKSDTQTVAVGPIRFQIQGLASWYGPGFDGNYTANGEIYNQYDLTAAHRDLPFGTRLRVTNLDNGRSVIVRVNDRGPFIDDRVLDLSRGAAQVIGTVSSGVSPVRIDVLN